ncbi:MAG: FadR/GntR family transcriptional regulator [Pseudomonadota bacterium]
MIFTPVDHDKTAREVERQIEALILQGVLRVGDRLPGERELSKSLAVSRPILRQALSALEARELLVTRHGGGTFVADVIGSMFAPPVVELIGRDSRARSDYLEYRREIEAVTAALAARRATDADRTLLERIGMEMKAAHLEQDPTREGQLDVELHSTISECTHNIMLLHTMRACYRLLSDEVFFNRGLIYDDGVARDSLLSQHMDILNAILEGRDTEAAEASAAHISFIIEMTHEGLRRADWQTIAEVRLEQRRGIVRG